MGSPTLRRGFVYLYRKVGGRGRKGRENLPTRWKKKQELVVVASKRRATVDSLAYSMAAKKPCFIDILNHASKLNSTSDGGCSTPSGIVKLCFISDWVSLSLQVCQGVGISNFFFYFHSSVISWYQRFLYIPMMFVSKKLSSGVEGLGSRNLIILLSSSRHQ